MSEDGVTRKELNGWSDKIQKLALTQERHDVKIIKLEEAIPELFKKMDDNKDSINAVFVKLAIMSTTVTGIGLYIMHLLG